jgi:hypothetical protein
MSEYVYEVPFKHLREIIFAIAGIKNDRRLSVQTGGSMRLSPTFLIACSMSFGQGPVPIMGRRQIV